jgi:hypothetical protein
LNGASGKRLGVEVSEAERRKLLEVCEIRPDGKELRASVDG